MNGRSPVGSPGLNDVADVSSKFLATDPNAGRPVSTMKMTAMTLVMMATSVIFFACGGEPDDADGSSSSDGRGPGTKAAGGSLVDRCTGTLTCSVGSEATPSQLLRRDGACYLGGIRLGADGSATAEDVEARWIATASTVDVCIDGECMSCRSTEGASSSASQPSQTGSSSTEAMTPSKEEAEPTSRSFCAGHVPYCHRLSYSQCATQDGCELYKGQGSGGASDWFCSGTAKSCTAFTDPLACQGQVGCLWYSR